MWFPRTFFQTGLERIYYVFYFNSIFVLHFRISHFANADEFTDTTLRIITIEKRQYGKYICKAVNKLGNAEAEVELFGEYVN